MLRDALQGKLTGRHGCVMQIIHFTFGMVVDGTKLHSSTQIQVLVASAYALAIDGTLQL